MNRYKEDNDKKEGAPRRSSLGKGLVRFLNGGFLSRNEVVARLPYFFFLAFLLTCYIGYGYYTEKTVKELYRTRKDLKELRSEYITTKSRLMFRSKRSEVVKATEGMGLRESTDPPEKILIRKEKE